MSCSSKATTTSRSTGRSPIRARTPSVAPEQEADLLAILHEAGFTQVDSYFEDGRVSELSYFLYLNDQDEAAAILKALNADLKKRCGAGRKERSATSFTLAKDPPMRIWTCKYKSRGGEGDYPDQHVVKVVVDPYLDEDD